MASPKKILVSHPWVARGGSEATAMWVLDALQHRFDITFATAHVDSWDELNSAYGTSIDSDRVEVVHCRKLPMVNSPTRLVHLQHRHFEKFCQKLAPQFDLCISSYNPVDFGDSVRSIQLIGDFSFSEKMRRKLYGDVHDKAQHQDSFARKLYLKLGDWMGVKQKPLHQRANDHVVANSQWAVNELETEFNLPDAPILYPPVILPAGDSGNDKKPLSFVCLGRVSPEKRIEDIVEILKRVRDDHGVPVTLTLIGQLDDSGYSQKIESLISENLSWITPAGFLSADAKQKLLASHEFALHACRIEAFGIAVAEMASLGCVPFVPATGGSREIVESADLIYDSIEDGVQKILTLIKNPALAEQRRDSLTHGVHRFGPVPFSNRLVQLIEEFQTDQPPVDSVKPNLSNHVQENSPALG